MWICWRLTSIKSLTSNLRNERWTTSSTVPMRAASSYCVYQDGRKNLFPSDSSRIKRDNRLITGCSDRSSIRATNWRSLSESTSIINWANVGSWWICRRIASLGICHTWTSYKATIEARFGRVVKAPTSLKVWPGLTMCKICSLPEVDYLTAFNVPEQSQYNPWDGSPSLNIVIPAGKSVCFSCSTKNIRLSSFKELKNGLFRNCSINKVNDEFSKDIR